MRSYPNIACVAIATAVSAIACGSSGSNAPIVYQAGMAWDYPDYDVHPIPVWWNGADEPTRLPMLTYQGDCPPGGEVRAMTAVNGEIVMVGISSICDGSQMTMKPVIWSHGSVIQLAGLPGHIVGVANDIAVHGNSVFIVGATGTADPTPVVWWDGYPIELPLPSGYAMGEASKIVIEGDQIYVSALISTETPPVDFAVGYWTIDSSLQDQTWTQLTPPEAGNKINLPIPLAVVGTDVWASGNFYTGDPKQPKPGLVKNGGSPEALIDFDFANEPYGLVSGLKATAATTYAVGYENVTDQYGLPGPVIWTGTTMVKLSTADSAIGLGIAEEVVLVGSDVYVAGFTYTRDAAAQDTLISVPAYWLNGVRHDRQGLPGESGVHARSGNLGSWSTWPALGAAQPVLSSHYTENVVQSAVANTIYAKRP